MPHFVIECSESVLMKMPAAEIISAVYNTAEASGLFREGDIKVRIRSYTEFKLGEGKEEFLHVFAHIMQGRTKEQRQALSRAVVSRLNELMPALPILSMNVYEFEKATYYNKQLL
jgi:5-carboxymethyl-2-hydroxymuconate isomerase